MAGFPNLYGVPVQTIPIFLSSMVDQNITPPYLDITESYGVPADVCPLPSAEAGVAINDDYPMFGKCFLSCNMPCDGSTMNSSYIDRRFNLPSHVVNVPLRYTEEEVQKYAVDEVKSFIRFIEEQTGEKFDWDAYFSAMKIYNKQLEYELQKWDVNKTDYPQMTGATFWLYRLFYFHLSGGIDKIFIKTDKKVNKLMMKGYERKEHVSKEMRHRAIVWSCPANYYTSLANWLENCWGINVVMDMETMISYIMYDTEDKERSLATYAKTLQRTTMRKHTKGGYQNVLDELWRICDEYNADTVIMYNQISCQGMDGLNGIFDDQARERNINFIWVDQDLMDPRTVSRRDMLEQIRVSKKAVKNGVTFSDYGSSLIKAYLKFPMVKSVQIIFITDFDRFNELGMICDKVRQTTDALNHILDNVLLDCNTCNLKSICDEVEGMKELHMKNAAKKQ